MYSNPVSYGYTLSQQTFFCEKTNLYRGIFLNKSALFGHPFSRFDATLQYKHKLNHTFIYWSRFHLIRLDGESWQDTHFWQCLLTKNMEKQNTWAHSLPSSMLHCYFKSPQVRVDPVKCDPQYLKGQGSSHNRKGSD